MDQFPAEIMQFRGEFDFLSNFHPVPVVYAGREWQTSEHAYQAAKTLVPEEIERIAAAKSPGQAKRLGRPKEEGGIVTLRPKWAAIRVDYMSDILDAKFAIPEMERKLLGTEGIWLIEGNIWNDVFWGVDINRRVGQNNLGKLLMRKRDDKLYFG